MLIGLCVVAFVLGWALSSYYTEQKREEKHYRKMQKMAKMLNETNRKQDYLEYVWNSYK